MILASQYLTLSRSRSNIEAGVYCLIEENSNHVELGLWYKSRHGMKADFIVRERIPLVYIDDRADQIINMGFECTTERLVQFFDNNKKIQITPQHPQAYELAENLRMIAEEASSPRDQINIPELTTFDQSGPIYTESVRRAMEICILCYKRGHTPNKCPDRINVR